MKNCHPNRAHVQFGLWCALALVFGVALLSSGTSFAQEAQAAAEKAADRGWFERSMDALDNILNLQLSITLTGLSMAIATFASVSKANLSDKAESSYRQNLKRLDDLPENVDATQLTQLRKETTETVKSQKRSDELDVAAGAMLRDVLRAFHFFVLCIVVTFVGDTFIGRDVAIVHITIVTIENLVVAVLLGGGIYFLFAGAGKMRVLHRNPTDRATMLLNLIYDHVDKLGGEIDQDDKQEFKDLTKL